MPKKCIQCVLYLELCSDCMQTSSYWLIRAYKPNVLITILSHAYNCSYLQAERTRQVSITSPPASQTIAPPISTSGAEGGGGGGGGGGSGKVDLLGDLGTDPFGMNIVCSCGSLCLLSVQH